MKTLIQKWETRCADLEANVTRIWQRRELHMCFDVMAHSILAFPFQGKEVVRGWVEVLVPGDTRTGKSEVATRLCEHMGMSRPLDCERVSMPGVVGGIDKLYSGQYNVVWGAVPRHDRMALVLDEFGGLTPEQISSMSGIRSSGRAEITKIHAESTMARVRKMMLCNMRTSGRSIHDFTFGVTVIPPIIGKPEDVARFDFALCVSAAEVPLEVLNQKHPPVVKQVFTPAADRAALQWAWTRRPADVEWESGAEDRVMDVANHMCKDFHPMIPLVEPGEQRIKVARVSAALAALFVSTDGAFKKLIIRKRHVDLAEWFFYRVYDTSATEYLKFSRHKYHTTRPPDKKDEDAFAAAIKGAPWERALINGLLDGDEIQDMAFLDPQVRAKVAAALIDSRLSSNGHFANAHFKNMYSRQETK